MVKAYVALLLHFHLPYIRHPELQNPSEELWLFEAIHESYLPLIEVFQRLTKDKVNFRIAVSLSPTLLAMLQDPYLSSRLLTHMEKLVHLSESEMKRTKDNPVLHSLAAYYHERFSEQLDQLKANSNLILDSLKELEKSGQIVLFTTAATHALLPLLMQHPQAINAQLQTGLQQFEQVFGHRPEMLWLPECAYYHNLEQPLLRSGIKAIVSESTTVLHADPSPAYGTSVPVRTHAGLAVFPRDPDASMQVWSSISGYPGDAAYREFYTDIGHQLDLPYLQSFGFCGSLRHDTGLKYDRVTGAKEKLPYDRKLAVEKAVQHGRIYAKERFEQLTQLATQAEAAPVITCPFDAELFGHWWYEGPEFLEAFLRESVKYQASYSLIAPTDYLDQLPSLQSVTLEPGSWGEHGDFSTWLNRSNDWITKELFLCRAQMSELAAQHKNVTDCEPLLIRALQQAARELMLAESSDWQFMINKNSTAAYAICRVTAHIENIKALLTSVKQQFVDEPFLEQLEQTYNLFPFLDYTLYA